MQRHACKGRRANTLLLSDIDRRSWSGGFFFPASPAQARSPKVQIIGFSTREGAMPRHMNRCRKLVLLTVAAVSISFGTHAVSAQSPRQKPQAAAEQAEAPPRDSELYCKNIAEAASDARIKWQTWKLISLEARLRDRIDELQRKEKEFEAWVKRREDLLNEVEDQVVTIIGRMRPEAAAAQLSTTDEEAAVGVLLKLKARVASSILDEMEPSRAAQLTQSMMGFTNPEAQRSF